MKKYNPKEIEQNIYNKWEKNRYFQTKYKKEKNFCIMLPPPNITGFLHMGHAFQQTIMDAIIRYNRMNGKNVLWQIGTDHAGIATQILVERKLLLEEGKNRLDYTRKEFNKKIIQWKNKSIKKIYYQMKRLGNSADWSRDRFTMDEGLSEAVNEVFVSLYKENLIYRKKSLVNWDPKLMTAISDLEIENKKTKGFMYYIRYPIADNIKTIDNKKYLVVATTRPETIIGDTALAINPKDSRYNNLKGQFVTVPIIQRRIPIIYDDYVDINKGSGCVKITPAHDFNDYLIGIKHNLIIINIMTNSGHIKEYSKVYDSKGEKTNFYNKFIPHNLRNLDRFLARKNIVNQLKENGFLEKVDNYDFTIPYSERSGVVIEPMLKNQWFLKTKKLAKSAISIVKNNEIKFFPDQYKNMYFAWMLNIKDWCISRQLWWGHRIPAWYDKLGNIYVGRNENEIRKINFIKNDINLKQDNDVLDTWFSSALWTFATLGWPKKTNELKMFHPTDVLVSGFDIIFFWIARMIMITIHFIKNKDGTPQIPFKDIYITGLIKDESGQKMSKSKGNVIDPLDIIDGISLEKLLKKRTNNMMQPKLKEKIYKSTKKKFPIGIKPYGADSLRFTLLALASNGRDINWDMNRLAGYSKFCNKLWNASKFVILNTKNKDYGQNNKRIIQSLADKWILSELNQTIKLYHDCISNYRFDILSNLIYDFIWNKFCDWYLELSKISLATYFNKNYDELIHRSNRKTLLHVLKSILCLSHPIIPFITEEIWQKIHCLKEEKNEETIMFQTFPKFNEKKINVQATLDINWIKKIVFLIRNIKSKININNSIEIVFYNLNEQKDILIKENIHFIKKLVNLPYAKFTILDCKNNKVFSSLKNKIIDEKIFDDGTKIIIYLKD